MTTDTTAAPVRDRERLAREYTVAELAELDTLPLAVELRAAHAAKKAEVRGRQAIIVGLVRVAADMCGQFAREHDAACGCGDCSPRLRFIPAVWDEAGEAAAQRRNHVFAGLAFLLETAAAAAEGCTPGEFARPGDTWQDDLRSLLAMEEAQPDPEPAAEGQPDERVVR